MFFSLQTLVWIQKTIVQNEQLELREFFKEYNQLVLEKYQDLLSYEGDLSELATRCFGQAELAALRRPHIVAFCVEQQEELESLMDQYYHHK